MEFCNILILCSTEETIKTQKWKKILDDVHIDHSEHHINTYFYGIEVNFDPPFKINDFTQSLKKHFNQEKFFDAIISENCPQSAFTENMEDILFLLKDDGLFISPSYDCRSPFHSYVINNFKIIKTENNFTVSIKL
jgi:hypothetical protein